MTPASPTRMKRVVIGIVAIVALQLPLAAQGTCRFTTVPSADAVSNFNDLVGVTANTAGDAWAVGFYADSSNADHSLVEHWNGTKWSIVASPDPSTKVNDLLGSTEASSSDVWAVGEYLDSANIGQPLIEHWNGIAWSVIASPPTGTTYGAYLFGVKAISSTNVWAVGGTYIGPANGQTLIEHWDGSTWSIVPSPNVNSINDLLSSISATGANDVWAGGVYSPTMVGVNQSLIEHWNGVAWSIVPSPNMTANSNNVNAVAALAPKKAYATGDYFTGSVFDTLAETWNGFDWALVPAPNHGTLGTQVNSMAASARTGVLAVGLYGVGGSSKTFAMRLKPTGWTTVPSDNPSHILDYFNGASAIPGTDDAWAVGATQNSRSQARALIELFHC